MSGFGAPPAAEDIAGAEPGNGLPRFAVRLEPPNLDRWRAGNDGIPGFVTRESGAAGPHVVVVALVHGNELAGAIVADRLLAAGLRPRRGRLTMGFANLDAFDRFDPREPTASRFVDEDFNRLWDAGVLEGPLFAGGFHTHQHIGRRQDGGKAVHGAALQRRVTRDYNGHLAPRKGSSRFGATPNLLESGR